MPITALTDRARVQAVLEKSSIADNAMRRYTLTNTPSMIPTANEALRAEAKALAELGFGGSYANQGSGSAAGNLRVTSTMTANSSARMVQTVPRKYTQVRAVLYNVGTAAAAGLKVSISPSEALTNGGIPTINGVADNSKFVTCTWGGSTTVTAPAQIAAGVPSRTVSDWMDVVAVDRTDEIGGLPLVYTTRYNLGTEACGFNQDMQVGVTPFITALPGSKRRLRLYYQGGVDAVANPASFTNGGTLSNVDVPLELEFRYVEYAPHVVQSGDSTKSGQGNTQHVGPIWYAASTYDGEGNSFGFTSLAEPGLTAANTYQRLLQFLSRCRTDVVYCQPFSVNDSTNYAGSSGAAIIRAQSLLDLCAARGLGLVMETPLPILPSGTASGVSGAELTAYQLMYNTFMGMRSERVRVIDMSVLHDPAKPGVWSVDYGFDGYHPNANGHFYQGTQLTNELRYFI